MKGVEYRFISDVARVAKKTPSHLSGNGIARTIHLIIQSFVMVETESNASEV
jgi:hypothetical protein